MPPRVYEAHLKKSHTPEEVAGQIEKNEKEIGELGETLTIEKLGELYERVQGAPQVYTECNCPCQKRETCISCGKELSAIIMFAHAKIVHGV